MKYLDAARRRRLVHDWMSERRGAVDRDRLDLIKQRGLRESARCAKYRRPKE